MPETLPNVQRIDLVPPKMTLEEQSMLTLGVMPVRKVTREQLQAMYSQARAPLTDRRFRH